jgi:hypothetical protein
MSKDLMTDKLEIRETVDNWILYRDAGEWERFRTVNIFHFYGGFTCDIAADRAIAQTKMTINQRAPVDGVLVDVVCTGRMYDFFQKHDGRWLIRRRQPIYEKDRMDPVDPAAVLNLDKGLLERFPEGYRHLAYLQSKVGFNIKPGLPGTKGDSVQKLYAEGKAWLAGSAMPGEPE